MKTAFHPIAAAIALACASIIAACGGKNDDEPCAHAPDAPASGTKSIPEPVCRPEAN